jgi:hypothetical protein
VTIFSLPQWTLRWAYTSMKAQVNRTTPRMSLQLSSIRRARRIGLVKRLADRMAPPPEARDLRLSDSRIKQGGHYMFHSDNVLSDQGQCNNAKGISRDTCYRCSKFNGRTSANDRLTQSLRDREVDTPATLCKYYAHLPSTSISQDRII